MSAERINIQYHGQELSIEEKAKIKAELSYHMGPGPSDASACFCLHKGDAGYACNLRVHSATGHIFMHRESKSLNQMLKFIYESMEQSFKNWHQDKKHFSKSHPLTASTCYGLNKFKIDCPLHFTTEEQTSSY